MLAVPACHCDMALAVVFRNGMMTPYPTPRAAKIEPATLDGIKEEDCHQIQIVENSNQNSQRRPRQPSQPRGDIQEERASGDSRFFVCTTHSSPVTPSVKPFVAQSQGPRSPGRWLIGLLRQSLGSLVFSSNPFLPFLHRRHRSPPRSVLQAASSALHITPATRQRAREEATLPFASLCLGAIM
jgi:hypothetical protein